MYSRTISKNERTLRHNPPVAATLPFAMELWTGASSWKVPLCLLLLSVLLAAGCSGEQKGRPGSNGRGKMPVPVNTAVAQEKSMPLELRTIGTVAASASVAITAQVEGELREARFREGAQVQAGEILFLIDPRVHAAQLQQAEGTLARDLAQLDHARKQLARYVSGGRKGYVSEEQIDQAQAGVATLEATVQADRAAAAQARLRLEFCTIRSPLTGLAGGLLVDPGNLIKANDKEQPLVRIRQLQPARVDFAVPERHLPAIRQKMAAGPVEVRATERDASFPASIGTLQFIDNTVEAATGSIGLRASFPNEDGRLWPGRFVSVVLGLGAEEHAVVVPGESVQSGQQGDYLYVVTSEQRAELRRVTLGRSVGEETVIREGLRPGETVVVRGQLRLAPGSTVKPAPEGMDRLKQEDRGA